MLYSQRIEYTVYKEPNKLKVFFALLLGSEEEIMKTIGHYNTSQSMNIPFPRVFEPASTILLPPWSHSSLEDTILSGDTKIILREEAIRILKFFFIKDREKELRGALYKVNFGDDPTNPSEDISTLLKGEPGMVYLPGNVLDVIQAYLKGKLISRTQ